MKRGSRILISGAGVAGLASAIWLGRAGFRPVVVERAPGIRAEGYIVSIAHNAYRFAAELGLLDGLRRRQSDILGSSYHDGSGRQLMHLDYQKLFKGLDIVQIMRDSLESLLYEAAKEAADYRFDVTATKIGQQGEAVQVHFSDGRQEEYDLVIGADGLHSAVRELNVAPGDVKLH